MKCPILWSVFMLLFSIHCSAQTISGRVIDRDSVPIVGVAVILQRLDSTYVHAVATDADGRFVFSFDVRPYRLLFEHLSYELRHIESSDSEIGEIQLADATQKLDAVVVKGEQPIVKIEDGKLAYNLNVVAERRAVDNAFDAIAKLPGVKESDGAFTLSGANAVTIILNGKPTAMSQEQLAQLLRSTPVERVEQAEVVFNAPPEWHIKGAAINVVLKKGDGNAIQGYLHGGWVNDTRNSYYGGGSFYYSSGKFSMNLMYDYVNDKSISRKDLWSSHTVSSNTTEIRNRLDTKDATQEHDVYVNLGYDFSDESDLSLTYSGSYTPRSTSDSPSMDNYFGNSYSRSKDDNYLHNLSLSYTSSFGLSTGFDYTKFRMQGLQMMDYAEQDTYSHAFDYHTSQDINQLKAYADMVHELGKSWKLKYGTQYRFVKNDNLQRYDDKTDDISGTREHTAEFYMGFSKSWLDGNLQLSGSMKGEYYKINEYEKWSPMPSAKLSYTISDDHYLQVSYGSLRVYPSYWDLQDYTSYSSQYIISRGNPMLRPEKYQIAELFYMLKNKYQFQISYYMVKDFFFEQAYQSPEELRLIYQTLNLDYTSAINMTVVIPFSIGNVLDSELTVTGYNERYKAKEWHDMSFDRNKWTGVIELDNTVHLSAKPKIAITAYGGYKSPTIQGIWDLSQMWFLDAGISWSFAKNKAMLRFKCNNILGSLSSPMISTDYESQHYTVDTRFFQRSYMLSLSYKFGGYTAHEQKEVDSSRFGK